MREVKQEQLIFDARTQYLTYSSLTGAFTVGQTLTGTDSSVTAVILADDGVSVLTVGTVSGIFIDGEAITDPITGAAVFDSISSLTGNIIQSEDYKFVQFTLSSVNDGDFVIKFQGSMSDGAPNFAAARSVANRWDYIQVKDLQSGSVVDGDTGVTFSAADDVLRYEAIFSGYKWVCATLTTYNAGNITLSVKLYDNR